jgi:hypothetical protein
LTSKPEPTPAALNVPVLVDALELADVVVVDVLVVLGVVVVVPTLVTAMIASPQ